MATVTAVLRSKKRKDGTYPLALRITKDRKSSFIHLGYNLEQKDWDKDKCLVRKTYPNSVRLNNLIRARIAEASGVAMDVEALDKSKSADTIKRKVKPKAGHTFFPQAEEYLSRLKEAGKKKAYTSNRSCIRHFKEFLKGHDIPFSDITVGLLQRFKSHLLATRDIGERTAINHLATIRNVFSQAINDEIIDGSNKPFGRGKIVIKFPETKKISIGIENVRKLESVQLSNPNHDRKRDQWLLSFYTAGMRVADVLRLTWAEVSDGRLYYKMGKNDKVVSLKLHDKALAILEKYRPLKDETDLVFPDLRSSIGLSPFDFEGRISDATSRIDKVLRKYVAPAAKIEGRLTMHIARHTFASIAGRRIPLPILQILFRHASITTTMEYMKDFLNETTDDALDMVLDYEQIDQGEKKKSAGSIQPASEYSLNVSFTLTDEECSFITSAMVNGSIDTNWETMEDGFWATAMKRRNAAPDKESYPLSFTMRELDHILKALELNGASQPEKSAMIAFKFLGIMRQAREEFNSMYKS